MRKYAAATAKTGGCADFAALHASMRQSPAAAGGAGTFVFSCALRLNLTGGAVDKALVVRTVSNPAKGHGGQLWLTAIAIRSAAH
jgi:hypothetical protein